MGNLTSNLGGAGYVVPDLAALATKTPVTSSRALTQSDNGKSLQCMLPDLTLTVPTGLMVFGCEIIPNGKTTVQAGAGVKFGGVVGGYTQTQRLSTETKRFRLTQGEATYVGGNLSAVVNMTLSSAAVGTGRTLTASAAFFLASDVGRTITWNGGEALITGYTSTTVVTASVTTVFPAATSTGPEWLLRGTPQTTNTPSATTGTVTMTLATAGWRAADVGAFVDINGGRIQITAYTDTTHVTGTVTTDLTGTSAAAANAWALRADFEWYVLS